MLIAVCLEPIGFAVAFLIPLREFVDGAVKEREEEEAKEAEERLKRRQER